MRESDDVVEVRKRALESMTLLDQALSTMDEVKRDFGK